MMQTFRRNTRLILFIVVASFVLLIFFQWGMDVTGIRKSDDTNIAKIDGKPVTYQDYIQYVQTKENLNRHITRDEIWQSLIDDYLWNSLINKEKIRTTDEEIWAIIKNNPPRQIYESEFMKNEKGEFDMAKYQQLLQSPQSRSWLLEYEMNLRREVPREKLRSLITTLAWVSPFEDSLTAVAQTVAYDLSFISLPIFRLRGQMSVSDAELKEYYQQNIKDFTTPEMKILKFVFFEKKPSSADTIEARERMEDVLNRIADGDTFLSVAQEVTDDTVVEKTFRNESELTPEIAAAFKKMKNGQLSSIIAGTNGYLVFERVKKDQIYLCRADIQVSPSTVGDLRDKIDAFKESAKENGFETAAQENNLTVRKTYPISADRINLPIRAPEALKGFLKHNNRKEIAGPYASIGGVYIFMIDSVIPEKILVFDQNIPTVKARYERIKLKDLMAERLNAVFTKITSGKSLEQIAAADTLLVFQNNARGVFLNQIQSGYGYEFAGAVATLEPGRFSPPLLTDWAGYIIRCDAKNIFPFDSTMLGMMQYKRQLRMQGISQILFTPKKITDNRDKFFE
jgi:hypothetical protein